MTINACVYNKYEMESATRNGIWTIFQEAVVSSESVGIDFGMTAVIFSLLMGLRAWLVGWLVGWFQTNVPS